MKTIKFLGLFFFLITLTIQSGYSQTPTLTDSVKLFIEDSFRAFSYSNYSDWEGVAVTITYDDQYWTTSIGKANDTGMLIDEDGKWLFRSFTKLIVSTVILQLYEEELIDLQAPISQYLDPIENVHMEDTIEDLLQMRSRTCQYMNSSTSVWLEVNQNQEAILDTKTMLEKHLPSDACNTNQDYDYNDASFQVLGLVIEAVTGESGEEVFDERIFIPNGMLNTSFAPIDVARDEFNGLYSGDFDDPSPHDQSEFSLNAALTSQKFSAGVMGSTKDILTFLKHLMDGDILKTETLELMKTNPSSSTYGMGLMIQTMSGMNDNIPVYDGTYYGHGGGGLNTSRTFYDPVRKIGFSFAYNSSSNTPQSNYNTEYFKEATYYYLRTCIEYGGCTQSTAGELVEQSFMIDDLERNYTVYVPSSYNGDTDFPLIVNFHGYTGDVPNHIDRTNMHTLADSLGFLIAYPVGLTITRDPDILPSFVPASGAGWSVPGFSSERNEILFMEALLDDIEHQFSIDEDRIHTTGLSLGGYMAAYIGTQMPERIASFATVAGHFTKEVNELLDEETQKSALLVHGTEDVITAYDGLINEYLSVESVADAIASNNNCSMDPSRIEVEDIDTNDNTTVTLFEYSECDSELAVHLYRVNEGGHRWPGSGITEPVGLGFNSSDISTSELVFEFFIDNPMPKSNNSSNVYTPVVEQLQEILDNKISTYGIEGVATTIVFPNEEVHTIGSGYGQNVNDPVDLDKSWHWASGTKPMTGFVILKLIEDGVLSIDDPVGKFLDTNSIPNLDSTITVKRLLQHTSGLSEIWSSTNNSALWQEVWNDRDRVWNPREFLNYMPAPFDGLTEHYYANTNSYILSFIIEEVTGKSLEENFQKFIFNPLAMTSSYLSTGKDIDMSNFNGAWLGSDNRSTLSHTSYLSSRSGNSAHIATSEDQVKFYRSYYSDELLSSDLMGDVKVPAEGSSEVIFENYACISKVTQLHGYETTMFEVIDSDGHVWNLFGHGGNGIHNSFTYHWEQKDLTIAMVINDFQVLEPSPFAALIFDVLCKIDEEIEDVSTVSSEEESQTSSPVDFILSQNYPNPFNPSTNISFDLPEATLVQLKVYNLLGQEVANLVDGRMNSGNHTVNFDASQLSSGVYIYRLIAGDQSITKKMMLIK